MLRILHSTNISFAVLFFIWLGLSIALLPLLESAQKNKMYNHFASNSIHSKKTLPENLKQFGHPGSVAAGHHPGRFGTSPRAARRQLLRPVNKPCNHQISLWHTLELQIEWRKIGTQPFRKEVGAFKATKACKKRSATTSWSNAVMMEKRSRNVASIQSQRVLPQNVSSDHFKCNLFQWHGNVARNSSLVNIACPLGKAHLRLNFGSPFVEARKVSCNNRPSYFLRFKTSLEMEKKALKSCFSVQRDVPVVAICWCSCHWRQDLSVGGGINFATLEIVLKLRYRKRKSLQTALFSCVVVSSRHLVLCTWWCYEGARWMNTKISQWNVI